MFATWAVDMSRAVDTQARFVDHRAMQVVAVVVVVVVDGQALGVLAEQLDEGRVGADLLRVPRAAHMAIQADHLVGGAHHQVQVVRDHQYAAAMAVAQLSDQAVQLGLAGDVDALHRLIQHQQARAGDDFVGQCAGGGETLALQVGDQLSKVNGQPLTDWQQFVTVIQNSPDVPVTIEVRRANGEQRFTVTPAAREVQGRKVGLVGLAPKVLPLDDKYRVELHYGPVEALWVGAQRTLSTMSLTLEMLKKLITGVVSLDNLSGPISIAKGAGSTASFGLVYFLGFLALVSVNLGIINLFPLPVLDGGHLLFFVIEAIKGSPVSEKVQEYAFKFGAAVLVCLMGIALFNDFVRL